MIVKVLQVLEFAVVFAQIALYRSGGGWVRMQKSIVKVLQILFASHNRVSQNCSIWVRRRLCVDSKLDHLGTSEKKGRVTGDAGNSDSRSTHPGALDWSKNRIPTEGGNDFCDIDAL